MRAAQAARMAAMITPVQMQILRARFPNIGEPVLRANAATLLGAATAMEPVWHLKRLVDETAGSYAPVPPNALKAVSGHSGETRGRQRVARTRNMGTLTESAFWIRVRWALRKQFQWWKPAMEALKRAKIGKTYLCAYCGKCFPRKGVQVDHKLGVGALTKPEHLAGFLERLTPENPDAFQVLCRECHRAKTRADRYA